MRFARNLLAASLLFSLSACGPAFQASTSNPSSNGSFGGGGGNNNGGGGNGGGQTPSDAAWNNMSIEGKAVGGPTGDTQVVSVDKEKKELVLHLPMTAIPILDGAMAEIPIPEIPGARLTLEPLPQGGSVLALRIPLEKLLRGIQFLPSQKLPNGDPLPAIPDGELPSVAVQLTRVKDIKATIYLAPSVVGIFVNSPFDPTIRASFPIYNQSRTRTWGYFSTVPAKKTPVAYDGGFFLSFQLPSDLARIIDDHL